MICVAWITVFTIAKLSSGNVIEVLNATDQKAYRVLVGHNRQVYIHNGYSLMQYNTLSLEPSNLMYKVTNPDCDPGNPSACPPSVFEMITLENTLYMIVCGSAYNATCLLHLASNISSVNYIVASNGIPPSAQFGSPVSAMIVHSPSRLLPVFSAISPASNSMHSDCSTNNCTSRFALSRRLLFRGNATSFYVHYEGTNTLKAKPNVSFRYIYGFYAIDSHNNHNAYFLKNRPEHDGKEIGYIIQICANDSNFRAYMEAKIDCHGYTTIVAATMLMNMLYVVLDGGTLQHQGHSVLCVYNVTSIGDFFDGQLKQCFHNTSGSTPDWIDGAEPACTQPWRNLNSIKCGFTKYNHRVLTSGSLTPSIRPHIPFSQNITCLAARADGDQGNALFVLGTNNGTILKAKLDTNYTLDILLSVSPTSSRVESLTMDPAGRAIFYISSGNVIKLSLDDCGIHSECAACLRDRTEVLTCHWIISTTGHGQCVNTTSAIANDTKYFQHYCPPIINLITPETGPTAGGTRLTIHGHFGANDATKQVHAFIGNNSCDNVDRSNFPTKLVCLTTPLSDFDHSGVSYEMFVRVSITANRTQTSTIPVNGEATSHKEFSFLEPWLNISDHAFSRQSGGVQMVLRGRHLNTGSNRTIAIGQDRCDVTDKDMLSNDTITCRTPTKKMSGVFNVSLNIDAAVLTGASIHYITDADVLTFHPMVTTKSGGIKMTVTGERLNGLGRNVQLTAVDSHGPNVPWVLDPGNCSYGDTSLVCSTGKFRGDPNDTHVIPILVNSYGWLTNNSIERVRVIKDPVLKESWRYISIEKPIIEIKGSGWSTIPIENFRVTVNKDIPCHVQSVNESIVCEVDVESNVFPQGKNLTVKCSIGFRDYDVGTVAFEQEEPDVRQSMAPHSNNVYTMYGIIAGSVIGCFALVTCIVISVVKYSRNKSRRLQHDSLNVHFRRQEHVLSLEGLSENQSSDVLQNRQNDYRQRLVVQLASAHEHSSDAKETSPLLPEMEPEILRVLEEKGLLINSECLILGEPVGEGHFGQVFKAYLRQVGENMEKTVAAKTIHRNNPKDMDVNMFIKEALIMKDFEHKNVMQLVGICFGIERLPLVVLPFLKLGDLLSYIRNVNNVPRVRDLVMYGVDIANGMQYLAELKFVHRDLAARNCMLADDMTVKVSDFGLSRDVYEKEYYSSGDKTTKLPVKWMSPESLEFGIFSSKSDVWSYGVVLWELLTRGMCPYPAVDNWDMMRYLKTNRRLEKPDFCPDEVYQVMLRCWQWEPDDRPTFSELVTSIPEILCRRGRFSSSTSRVISESDCK
ncbi:hepatocyte growth factor receptor-like [Dreissena polymorpha]|uniref:hepatocyte growth factor receptor-like n=1 Tax=Dreissena polymorpha TaxID=45954 RepID=UPI00226441B4|nr:hepatocyte growth factor receptor-like [Dreissena polymorpha]